MFGKEFLITYTNFSVRIGLIDVEYTCTEAYSQHHVNLLVHLSLDQVWTKAFRDCETYACGTSKVSTLGQSSVLTPPCHPIPIADGTRRPHGGRESPGALHPSISIIKPRIHNWWPSFWVFISYFAQGLGLIDRCANMRWVGGMRLLSIMILRAMCMIEQWDQPYGL